MFDGRLHRSAVSDYDVGMASHLLTLPTIQNWSCHNCSGCCRQHLIEVTEEERQRILDQQWSEEDGIASEQPVLVPFAGPPWKKRYRLGHQPDGACVFLDEKGLCKIHAKFGEAAKPLPGPNGEPSSELVDFDVFTQLESEFIAKHGADKFALIEANALVAPRGASATERELRRLRVDLEVSGFWEIDRIAWERIKLLTVFKGVVSIQNASSYGEWRQDEIALLDAQLQVRSGISSRAVAEQVVDQRDLVKQVENDYSLIRNGDDKLISGLRNTWVAEHIEDGLARQAIEWGYLDAGAPVDGDLSERLQAVGAADPVEKPEPEPQSTNLQTQSMADAFVAGRTLGQIGVDEDLTPKAVQMRLRRFAQANGFENPLAMREATL